MKSSRYIICFTILLFIIISCGEKIRTEITERYDDGGKKTIMKFSGEGETEQMIEKLVYSESGDTLMLEKPLIRMKMERDYYNGKIERETNYRDGVEVGYKDYSYYDNGQIDAVVSYKDDEYHGISIGYHENGQRWLEINWKDNNEYFVINIWNEDGELLVKDGNGKSIDYYENGEIRLEGNYKDGKEDGKWTFYYENGQIEEEGNFKDGKEDGKWIYYNEDGTIYFEKNYTDKEFIETD